MTERPPYRVVLADPPWTFRTYSAKGKGKSPEQHYACMNLDDLAKLGESLQAVTAPDAILLMWAIDPLLPQAILLGQTWGFTYKTIAFTWTKEKPSGKEHLGCGYYTRANPETCLLFRRGKGVPVQNRGVRQWLHAALGRHSQKPEESYARIERLFGDVPRLELFARQRRLGWMTVGNEIDGTDIGESLAALYADPYRCNS